MIVSDTEKFVFIHNPKCGGMSCHNALLKYDTRDNLFFEWRPVHGTDKILDMAHIIPFQLRRFFPKAFAEVQDYVKFTFVRDPYQRYLSAVSQHLKLGTGYMRDAILADPEAFYRVAAAFALTALKLHPVENDHKLVHFRPQVQFANIDGHRWADHVLKLEEPGALAASPVARWLPEMAAQNRTGGFAEHGYEAARLGPEAIAALNAFYARDFDSFGYPRM
ncbi:sulfotransferase family 2 domain-containing protein [Leisingera sp. ANG-Vp]|uniref:sulfotransferase family 2 domain-containing protein n=1 Tax=Leisingera sp. ANG-Vp TaxID=1577896 RepID=UPI000691FF51|nr:sulfotransferase family 2 domain-containing protein [Leisingera sp. ANG-Vp]